ncbi:UTP--glucose-1-phosphate uridylyltransferase [Fragilaria crotonensis]|nr:UTP--glucose-1-phosphate uridylyltransferase [Fragilaria crotonensis]
MWWSSPSKRKGRSPPALEKFLPSLTDAQTDLCKVLCSAELMQSHLFEHWGTSGDASPGMKRLFVEQLEALDEAYPTGLAGYIENARELLEKSKNGENPLEGWKPSIPKGLSFEIGTEAYKQMEVIGRHELGSVGFVLVAGGLGERLGYNDIKVRGNALDGLARDLSSNPMLQLGLPVDLATEKCYLEYYIEYILAVENNYVTEKHFHLPLCIMTSADTNAGTVALLEQNNYFGMKKECVTIIQQGDGVPALYDNDASIALEPNNQYKVNWVAQGIQWITFFQDTNGLAFHTLPLALGVSKENDLIMNSLAIPRKAKQAIGAIAKLTHEETGETRTINVEYNQLDPLLRANGFPDGDVNDPDTGFSPFPGNINQLVFKAVPYAEILGCVQRHYA